MSAVHRTIKDKRTAGLQAGLLQCPGRKAVTPSVYCEHASRAPLALRRGVTRPGLGARSQPGRSGLGGGPTRLEPAQRPTLHGPCRQRNRSPPRPCRQWPPLHGCHEPARAQSGAGAGLSGLRWSVRWSVLCRRGGRGSLEGCALTIGAAPLPALQSMSHPPQFYAKVAGVCFLVRRLFGPR